MTPQSPSATRGPCNETPGDPSLPHPRPSPCDPDGAGRAPQQPQPCRQAPQVPTGQADPRPDPQAVLFLTGGPVLPSPPRCAPAPRCAAVICAGTRDALEGAPALVPCACSSPGASNPGRGTWGPGPARGTWLCPPAHPWQWQWDPAVLATPVHAPAPADGAADAGHLSLVPLTGVQSLRSLLGVTHVPLVSCSPGPLQLCTMQAVGMSAPWGAGTQRILPGSSAPRLDCLAFKRARSSRGAGVCEPHSSTAHSVTGGEASWLFRTRRGR